MFAIYFAIYILMEFAIVAENPNLLFLWLYTCRLTDLKQNNCYN